MLCFTNLLNIKINNVVIKTVKSIKYLGFTITGVPHGSVLGPILFLLYINDIVKDIHGTVRLFADDTMIYMVIRSENDAARFQQDLDLLSGWGKTWMMEFHQDKCEIITITRKRNPTLYPYRLGEHLLNHVDCSK